MKFGGNITRQLRVFAADTSAAATVEFVLIAPFLFYIVFSVFEAGWLMTQQTMLARGLNMAVRDLRLGNVPAGTADEVHEDLKTRVCARARILRDCQASMHLELQIIDMSTGVPETSPACVDRTPESIQPVVNISGGARLDNPDTMFVRACVVVDPLLPGMALGAQLDKDTTGGFHMVAFSAFRNEP